MFTDWFIHGFFGGKTPAGGVRDLVVPGRFLDICLVFGELLNLLGAGFLVPGTFGVKILCSPRGDAGEFDEGGGCFAAFCTATTPNTLFTRGDFVIGLIGGFFCCFISPSIRLDMWWVPTLLDPDADV